MNSVKNGNLMGFDIEEINPILENKLSFQFKTEWNTKAGSIKTN